MERIMAIDFGLKRTGIAVTDPLQIIATALETVETPKIWIFLQNYFLKEPVGKVLLGYPTQDDGSDTHSTPHIRKFAAEFEKKFPDKSLIMRDEAFTSQKAMQILIQGGAKKKQRRDKSNLDKLSAVIILQEYLGH